MHETPREAGSAQKSHTRHGEAGTAENSDGQPASCLVRSAMRPNTSFTYSGTLSSAPYAHREFLKLSRPDSHCQCSRPNSLRYG